MYSMRDGMTNGRPEAALAAVPQPGAVDTCLRAIERIEHLVDEETAALSVGTAADLDGFTRRKSHALLELTRALRGFDASHARTLEPRLKPLRDKLAANAATLRRHLDAVQEVSAVLARAIRDAESDGTYTGVAWRGSRA
jgi:hypothetical protein